MGRKKQKQPKTAEIDGKDKQKKDIDNCDKSKFDNKSEATTAILKDDRKPTFGENSEINKKRKYGEHNINDLKESFNRSSKPRSEDKTHSVASKTDQKIRKSRNPNHDKITNLKSVLVEIDEDLFNLPKDYALAHCVAEDLRMGAGIAVEFKRYFGGVGKLIDQNLTIGNVGIVKRHETTVFYLVTKKNSSGKPTMLTLSLALHSLLQKMKELKLTKLGIPTIGCGLDGLDWSLVKNLIIEIFTGSGIHITVCKPSKILDRKQTPSLKVYITPKNVWEMEAQTDIILFINLDQLNKKKSIDDVEARVNTRYPFIENMLNDAKKKKINPGDMIPYVVNKEKIICVFTNQTEYYSNIENAFVKIKNSNKSYRYFAFQSGPIKPAENFKHISWVVLILRSIINNSELWLCGDTDQPEDKTLYDQYCRNISKNSRNYSSNFNSSGQMDYNKANDGDPNYTYRRSQNWNNLTKKVEEK